MNVYNVSRVCLFVCLLHYFPKQTKKIHAPYFYKNRTNGFVKKMYSCFNPFSLVPASSSVPLYFIYIDTAVTAIKLRV